MAVVFNDFSPEIKEKINQLGVAWLEEASGEVEAQTKRNTKVVTGKTKGSWVHEVHESELKAEVGSRYKNALWEEMGTGIHALNGDGRKDVPWTYKAPDGTWHKTSGKKPRRMLHTAYTMLKNRIIKRAQDKFKEMN